MINKLYVRIKKFYQDHISKRALKLVVILSSAALVTIAASCVKSVAASFSDGEKTGNELREYFCEQISKENDITDNNSSVSIRYVFDEYEDVMKNNNPVLVCGEIVRGENQYNDLLIAVFERGKQSFWNRLTETKPKYKLEFLTICKDFNSEGIPIGYCVDMEDIDANGKDEYIVDIYTSYADRTTDVFVIIQEFDDKWKIIPTDLSSIPIEYKNNKGDSITIHRDQYIFCNVIDKNDVECYGFNGNGRLGIWENTLYGKNDLLYIFTYNNEDSCFQSEDGKALVMMRESLKGLVPDPNWNGGNPLIIENLDNIDNIEDIEPIVDEKWGLVIGNTVFYGEDVE